MRRLAIVAFALGQPVYLREPSDGPLTGSGSYLRSRPEAARDERLLRRGSIAIDTRAANEAWTMLQWTPHRFAGWT
jgi:hypothetical protein